MKTAEKILLVSLDLFNEQGEPNISSVDIANELDISPGNLYYHFKGKDDIIDALVDQYFSKMKSIRAPDDTLEEFYRYLFDCLTTMHLFRFIFQNIAELAGRYPKITTRLQRLAKFQKKYLSEALKGQQQNQLLSQESTDINVLLEIIGLILFQSLNYYQMRGETLNSPEIEYRTLMTIFFSIQPHYLDQQKANNIKKAILEQSLMYNIENEEAVE